MRISLHQTFRNEEAQRYLGDRLLQGLSFGCQVAELFPKWTGRYFLLLPEMLDSNFSDFRYGGVCQGIKTSSLAEILHCEMQLHQKLVFFENALAKRGDGFLETMDSKPLFQGDEVYFAADESNSSLESLEKLIDRNITAQGFLAFLLPNGLMKVGRCGNLIEMGELAALVDSIVVSALDNETFLYWKRDR